MNLVDCYRVLGLPSGASFHAIKASYRQLARRYHPDVSSGDQRAKDKFIEVTAAYKFLLNTLADSTLGKRPDYAVKTQSARQATAPPISQETGRKPTSLQVNPNLSPLEQQLKSNAYQQLQHLLKGQRFPRAIALIEGLARRLPNDSEISQWQAIVYQQWGRYLIQQQQPDKARLYLKKALRTDPHNRSLWAEVEKDFRSLEQTV
ncbi:MAG: DnaJ domain-containing protein [Oscillatoriales cyanobacterium C42_A2020_001]|nr:DnaJ domain-containing protein [Leptolyngbyaceae cyanobacterium C42_A2020_001]